MSRFDINLDMRYWLRRRIQQLVGFFDVECEVLEIMSSEMGIDSSEPVKEVQEFYREVSIMTDEEFRKRLLQAVKKVQKKKELAGVC